MPKSKWARAISRVIQFLIILYVALLLLVFFAQRRLIYQPAKASYESLLTIAQGGGFEPWQNSSGEFMGWKQLSKVTHAHARLLIVHGNAGCAADRMDYANGLKRVMPLDVYFLEYPGYGARGGSPSQKSIFQAADEAMALLKKEGPVYLEGESLGTGAAAYLAGKYPEAVQGMLLIAPYDQLTHVAQAHMPIFPVKLMLWDRFPSAKYLQNYRGPIAMLFAGQDVIVPNRFGHALYDGYQGPKKFWEIPGVGHNDLLDQTDEWWQGLAAFWKSNAVREIQSK